ncbi:hypothetical protein [Croceicoccus naphthovorans]|uniref:Uncharacterized protein n=1 Tax=Croceicoccus naphthovorans TaxID=1348774 RepID=A0A0G3XF09_9SPHN|nr:hypothetical protein [Croceicoccus naphthovorans]AKM09226.1 hypothetical protein AB433_03375 [Croceicoccus naphthovorans]MBB3990386.1 hypothetical protein [Croceicoccus naphthovorans]
MGQFQGALPAAARWDRAETPSLDTVRLIGLVAGAAHLLRDAFAAPVRWWLDLGGLGLAWFAVDLIGVVALAAFAWEFGLRRRAPFALYALALLPISLFIAAATVGPAPAFLGAAFKMFVPIYAGWLLAGVDLPALSRMRRLLVMVCLLTIAGVVIDQFVTYPWSGLAIEQFGQEKTVDRVWWIQSVTRFGGFSGESTTAAMIALLTLLLVHRKLSPTAAIALGLGVIATCWIATSRTALVVSIMATVFIAVQAYFLAPLRTREAHRVLAVGSFLLVLVPLVMVVAASSIRFEEISPNLASFQQRVRESWQFPFVFLADRSPQSLVFGCGLGCLTFPARYSEWASLLRPIDNFYLTSFAMFGLCFVPLVAGMVLAALKEQDRTKLLLIAAINLYVLSVEAYSPAFALFVIGYATSGMHLIRLGREEAPVSRSALSMAG